MAREADLKKIELKVTVNCCDWRERMVKKLLRAVGGVLETEIDPVNAKVTVLRRAEPQVLIKKLARAGKLAERRRTSASGPPNDQKGKEEDREKGNDNRGKPEKCPDSVKSCASVATNSEGFCPPPTTTEEEA